MIDADKATIKILTKQLVRDAGGVEATAELIGVSAAQVSNYTNDHVDQTIPVHRMLGLSKAVNQGYMIDALKSLFDAAEKPQNPDDLRVMITKVHMESSEAVTAGMEAFQDGHMDHAEKAKLKKELGEALSAIQQLMMKLAEPGDQS